MRDEQESHRGGYPRPLRVKPRDGGPEGGLGTTPADPGAGAATTCGAMTGVQGTGSIAIEVYTQRISPGEAIRRRNPESDPRGGFDNLTSIGLAWSEGLRSRCW